MPDAGLGRGPVSPRQALCRSPRKRTSGAARRGHRSSTPLSRRRGRARPRRQPATSTRWSQGGATSISVRRGRPRTARRTQPRPCLTRHWDPTGGREQTAAAPPASLSQVDRPRARRLPPKPTRNGHSLRWSHWSVQRARRFRTFVREPSLRSRSRTVRPAPRGHAAHSDSRALGSRRRRQAPPP
jgi:hypothetical protein